MAQNVTLSKKTGAVKSTTSPRRKVSYPGKPLCLSGKSPSQSNLYDNFDYEDDLASTHKPTSRRSMGKSTEQLDFVENFIEKNFLSRGRTSLSLKIKVIKSLERTMKATWHMFIIEKATNLEGRIRVGMWKREYPR